MKAAKLIGLRLVSYIEDGINWKDHKDVILDYWINVEARKQGIPQSKIKNKFYVNELEDDVADIYEKWFKSFDFQNEKHTWIKFVDGSLNLFYKTKNPTLLGENDWFIYLLNSDQKANDIVENQLFHGNPDINTFWKIAKNGKAEEVSGRRNGYIFSDKLDSINKKVSKYFKWGVVFRAPDSVSLEYLDKTKYKVKCINWASHAKDIFLVKVTPSGKFQIVPSFIETENRIIPHGKILTQPMDGRSLNDYINKNYMDLFGIENIKDEGEKIENRGINARQAAINTLRDEEINVSEIFQNVSEFIEDGNVDDETRERNKQRRIEASKKKIEEERSKKRLVKKIEKQKAKDLKLKLKMFKKSLSFV